MALLHWRKFLFFDEQYIEDSELSQLITQEPQKDGQPFVPVKLSCSSSGHGTILLGDQDGYVYLVNKFLKVNSFKANQKTTTHVKQVPKSSIFITCGSDQDGINPLVKLWDPDKPDRLNQPSCLRLIRSNTGFIKPSRVTCIECNDNLTLLVIGYEDGSIVLLHGDVTKQRKSQLGRPIKLSDSSITGIVIRTDIKPVQPTTKEAYAFITTAEEIFHVNLGDKTFSKVQLDQMGCESKCCCLSPGADGRAFSGSLLAVGRDHAVYFYQVDGRGPCLAFEGEKVILQQFKSYLVIVSRDLPEKKNLVSTRVRKPTSAAQESHLYLNIYDLKNKFIAHSSTIPEIDGIVAEWGHLFIICSNGKLMVLREKDNQTKLEILFRKDQFSLVIDLARDQQYDEDALCDIFKHYGDSLFRRGDYDGAIQQYIRTIGRSEPSYVIKKYLDSQRTGCLIVYLEALNKKGQASRDHKILLLICYSKLRDDEKLKQFIEENDIKMPVDMAVKVLRDAGYDEFANYLAGKYLKREQILMKTVEDNRDEAVLEKHLYDWRNEKDDLLRSMQADEIKNLLASTNDKFGLDRALILCRSNRFDEGLVQLFARAGHSHLVLQYYIDQGDSLKIIKTCEELGPDDPKLYMPALIHYSKTGDERLCQILKAIEHRKIIPPMAVIKVLLDSKLATLGSVKEYLLRFLGKLHDRCLDNENAIDQFKDDTEVVRKKIEDFENYQTVFKPSKCSACQGILDLPSVHFLCSHSYHGNCFNNYSAENDECPICITINRELLEEIGSHETSRSIPKDWQKSMTDDAFNNVAKLFGYGLFK